MIDSATLPRRSRLTSERHYLALVDRLQIKLLDEITTRAERTYRATGHCAPAGLRDMLAEAHAECPLDLRGLLEAGEMDFAHDIGGIVAYFDRVTRKFKQCFLPRFTRRPVVAD